MAVLDFITNQAVPIRHKLISLNLVSLYTNIYTDFSTNSINQKWCKIPDFSSLTKEAFCDAIELCLNTTHFKYNN